MCAGLGEHEMAVARSIDNRDEVSGNMALTAISRFARVARQYCRLVENAERHSLQGRVKKFEVILGRLCSAAVQLPHVEPRTERTAQKFRAELAHWPGFGRFDQYWEVFDPYQTDNLVSASLSDDLLDVYVDLQRGFLLFDRGTADSVTDAVWDWRFGFLFHWGDHAVDALRALHRATKALDSQFGEFLDDP